MKISTKGRYALRMMLDLAAHQGDGYVALKDIAQRQEISKKYLEQIVPMLGKSDILRTTRGYQGGYRLARAPKDYTVGEILRLTEGRARARRLSRTTSEHLPALRRVRHPAHVGGAGARHPQLSRRHHASGSARAADGACRERLRHLIFSHKPRRCVPAAGLARACGISGGSSPVMVSDLGRSRTQMQRTAARRKQRKRPFSRIWQLGITRKARV